MMHKQFKKVLKQAVNYLFWTVISMLTAFGYVRIILGSKPEKTNKFMTFLNWLYDIVLVYVVPIVGSVIAIVFILTDIFFLKKRLQKKSTGKKFLIRFITLIVLTCIIGLIHYFLEKVIDVI